MDFGTLILNALAAVGFIALIDVLIGLPSSKSRDKLAVLHFSFQEKKEDYRTEVFKIIYVPTSAYKTPASMSAFLRDVIIAQHPYLQKKYVYDVTSIQIDRIEVLG